MTYEWQGRQFVVIAAGGHGEAGSVTSDALVAFSLPTAGEAPRGWWDRHVDQPGGRLRWGASAGAVLLGGFGAAALGWRRRRPRSDCAV